MLELNRKTFKVILSWVMKNEHKHKRQIQLQLSKNLTLKIWFSSVDDVYILSCSSSENIDFVEKANFDFLHKKLRRQSISYHLADFCSSYLFNFWSEKNFSQKIINFFVIKINVKITSTFFSWFTSSVQQRQLFISQFVWPKKMIYWELFNVIFLHEKMQIEFIEFSRIW